MSHFILVARFPSTLHQIELDFAIEDAMIPYKEAGWGSDDPPELARWMQFDDAEDAYLKEYQNDSQPMVVLANGQLISKYDESFRNKDYFKKPFTEPQFVYPKEAVHVEIPHIEIYSTFEKFMAKWHSQESRDEKTNRYGHWRNPYARWDWYQIGGRWHGYFDGVDTTRIKDLDIGVKMEEEKLKRFNEFWSQWLEFLDGKEFDAFEGPRDTAMKFDMLTWKSSKDLTGKEYRVFHFKDRPDPANPGEHFCDVVEREVYVSEVFEKCSDYFFPIRPYAYLDARTPLDEDESPIDRWHAPAEMGWFGVSHGGSANGYAQHGRKFYEWLTSGDNHDWLVAIDCHI